jgi:hypothetical protein
MYKDTIIDLLSLKLILNSNTIRIYLNYILEIYGKKHFRLTQKLITILKKICKIKLKIFSKNKV